MAQFRLSSGKVVEFQLGYIGGEEIRPVIHGTGQAVYTAEGPKVGVSISFDFTAVDDLHTELEEIRRVLVAGTVIDLGRGVPLGVKEQEIEAKKAEGIM